MHHPTYRITHTTAFVTPVMEHLLEREIAQWVHPMKDRSDDPSHHVRTLLPQISLPLCVPVNIRITDATESSTSVLMLTLKYSILPESSRMVRWVVGSILHGVNPLSYFAFQPVPHDWCNKGRDTYYPVSCMMHIK